MSTQQDSSSNVPSADSAARGIPSLPMVGRAAGVARQIFEVTAPNAADSKEVRVVKEVFRWSTVVAGSAAWALVVLGS